MDNKLENLQQEIDTQRTILNNLTEGIIVADTDGQFIYFNPVAEKILGIGAQNIKPSEWTPVYGCYYQDTTTPYPSEQLPLARALRGETAHDQLYIHNTARTDGAHIDITASPLRNPAGEITGGMVIFREITHDVHSQKLIRESRERLQAQFKGVPIPTFVWKYTNNDFTLLDCNKAAESFLTDHIENYLGAKLSEMYANYPEVQDDFARCYLEKATFKRKVRHYFKGIGETRDLWVTYVHAAADIVMVHTEDVTEQLKAQHELEKYFNAVKQTADSVMITNLRGVIEYVNPAFEETTGYSSEEAVGNTPAMLRSGLHDNEFYQNLWDTITNGQPFRATIINKKKNGELFWCQQTISCMKDNDGNISHFVSVTKDITHLKEKQEMEFRLRVAHELQQRMAKSVRPVKGYDIAGRTFSAVETSGDFFDIIDMPDGQTGIVIADVCGHGIGAAMIMAETRAFLRAFAHSETDPATILERLNRELVIDLNAEHFVTLVLARIDPDKQTLVYASAGHGKAYLLNRNGSVLAELASTGIPLGFMQDVDYTNSVTYNLSAQDMLVLLTDGVSEAHNSKEIQFGDKRALEVIKKHRNESSASIIETLYTQVGTFTGRQAPEDDMTAVICKVNPQTA
ncbi:MAG: SpoIIE family protein phosphatase [candidate division KSB1 bacterium]|nr:SpoIIE family protein phosphatase [candidate division KSB1 bacterium]